MSQVYTVGKAAKLCHVAPRTAAKWFDQGKLKGYRIPCGDKPGDRRILGDSLVEFMQKHGFPLNDLPSAERGAKHDVLLLGIDAIWSKHLEDILDVSSYRLQCTLDLFHAGILVATVQPKSVVLDAALGKAWLLSFLSGLPVAKLAVPPQLIILANEDDANPKQWLTLGFNHYLKKPVPPKMLAQLIINATAVQAA